MLKKYIPFFVCFIIGLFLAFSKFESSQSQHHVNTYPNLPAPIGEEKVLITSAGQAIEGTIIFSLAESLNLDADYRPRALDTDLYDYKSVIIVLGYSANGLSQINRSLKEERIRVEQIVKEASANHLPLIMVNLAGPFRNRDETWELFETAAANLNYYIGVNQQVDVDRYLEKLKASKTPVTLVKELDELHIPLNSAFR